MVDSNALGNAALLIVTVLGMYLAAFWLALIIWTYRDHHARSRDGLASLAAGVMVAVLFLPGLLIYLLLRPKETLAEAYERALEEEALLQEIEEKPVCPGCGRPTDAAWQACPHCHTTLQKPCVKCGQMLDLAWNQCPYCTAVQPNFSGVAQGQQRRQQAVAPEHDAPPTANPAPEFIDSAPYR